MIVHEPKVTRAGAIVRVEAAIEVEHELAGLPSSLWFELPQRYERYLTERADALAVAALPLAMHLGEPLRVEGSVSWRLAHGLREYQRMQCAWVPGFFRPVEVSYGSLCGAEGVDGAGGVGLAFSGGVDSLHALLRHAPAKEPLPPSRVSHGVMINGFDEDSDVHYDRPFTALQAVYEPLMAALGVELVVVRTNLLDVQGAFVRSRSFAAFLVAPALLLGRLFSRFYIASGMKFTTLGLYQDGSHPMLDHLLATESLETLNVDAHLSRVEKTLALAAWPETYDRLRVCWRTTGVQPGTPAITNCCDCDKCVRTMATLEAAGALHLFRCFPLPLQTRRVRAIDYGWEPGRMFAREIVDLAVRNGRHDLVRAIRLGVLRDCWLRPAPRAALRLGRLLRDRLIAAPTPEFPDPTNMPMPPAASGVRTGPTVQ